MKGWRGLLGAGAEFLGQIGPWVFALVLLLLIASTVYLKWGLLPQVRGH